MVEFALILPLLIIIIVGVFDLGRAFFAYITITNAAREGARYGTLHTDELVGQVQSAAVTEATSSGINITSGNVVVTCPDTATAWPCGSGESVKVTVSYTFNSWLNMIIPASVTMQRSVEMAVP